jgi:circadian clock protein KaiC
LQTTHQREIKRVKTGILPLDELIGGGFPKSELVLLAGYAGTGKTIFCTEFIYHGAVQYNEKGVYAVLEGYSSAFEKNMRRLGYDLERLETENKVQIIDVKSLKGTGLSLNVQLIIET